MTEAIVGAIVGVALTILCGVLRDRSKRTTPDYGFKFEKKIDYQVFVHNGFYPQQTTEYLENCICIKNHGDISLSNVSTEVHFENKKERSNYKRMDITRSLFNLDIEYLSGYSPFPNPSSLWEQSRKQIIRERRKTGFFIDGSDMEKLKCFNPIKVKIKYKWDGKRDSDIWLFDFSDENEVIFDILPPPIWRRVILFFKRLL